MQILDMIACPGSVALILGDPEDETRIQIPAAEARDLAIRLARMASQARALGERQALVSSAVPAGARRSGAQHRPAKPKVPPGEEREPGYTGSYD